VRARESLLDHAQMRHSMNQHWEITLFGAHWPPYFVLHSRKKNRIQSLYIFLILNPFYCQTDISILWEPCNLIICSNDRYLSRIYSTNPTKFMRHASFYWSCGYWRKIEPDWTGTVSKSGAM
jgi:hypothetical protein